MDKEKIIADLKRTKMEKGYTLYDLSKKLDVQIATIERWFKTKRINKLYALYVAEKLKSI